MSRGAAAWNSIDTLWQDVRFSFRGLARTPGFAITAILVLSLGVGLNLTFFQLINVVFLKPLPIRDPETIVNVRSGNLPLTYGEAQYIATRNNVFSSVTMTSAAFGARAVVWERDANAPVRSYFVSPNWFEELGVRPLRGQFFSNSTTGSAGGSAVAVISEHYWESRLGSEPAVIGSTVRLNNRPVTILGVVPDGFGTIGGDAPNIWLPMDQMEYVYSDSTALSTAYVTLLGRLRPNVSVPAARLALVPVVEELAKQQPRLQRDRGVALYRGSERFRAPDNGRMWALIGVCGSFTLLILIVTCANLANLILSRAAERLQELSIRVALGASRRRVMRHLLSETAIVSIFASAGALFLAYAGTKIAALVGRDFFQGENLNLDWRTVAAAAVATILTTALIGLLPAWTIGNRDLAIAMRDGGQQASMSLGRARQRKILLAVQVAAGCLLLVIAGLVFRSLQQILVPPGFDYENVIVAEQYSRRGEPASNQWGNVRASVAELPGIEGVALVDKVPLRAGLAQRLESRHSVRFNQFRVEPDFFRIMRIRFVEGGAFGPDAAANPVILSRSLAQQMYGASSAVGQPFAEVGTIVGVVDDVHLMNTDSVDFPQVYLPLRPADSRALIARARTKADTARLLPAVTGAMQDFGAVVIRTRLLETDLADRLRGIQVLVTILASLATLALSVACMGIYGVVSYNVAVRRKEIGIRLALGARYGSVVVLMIEQLVWPVSIAIVGGIIGGVIVARIFEANGGPFSPPDTPVMTSAAMIILISVALSCIVPTLRALKKSDTRVLS
jgi:predicted permease